MLSLKKTNKMKVFKVLHVEDNDVNRLLMRSIINKRSDLDLFETETAELALPMLEGDIFDLILLDLDLPGMSGFEFKQLLSEDERFSHIPVIAVTASAMTHEIEAAQQYNFYHYITKPIIISDLFQLFDELVK